MKTKLLLIIGFIVVFSYNLFSQATVVLPDKNEGKTTLVIPDKSEGKTTLVLPDNNEGKTTIIVNPVDPKKVENKTTIVDDKQNRNDVLVDVDMNIPQNPKNTKRFALIFGNENYIAAGGLSSDVDFAIRDAAIFKQYAINTLGIPEDNILYAENATRAVMKTNIDLFVDLMSISPEQKEFYVYYAGHGYPDANNDAYMMPVDVKAKYFEDGIKLSEFYAKLQTHNTKKTVVFLDACFSGAGRNGELEKARAGVRRTPNAVAVISNNILIFAAASEDQVSKPYNDKKHGIFSYYLFQTLQETKGKITYAELVDAVIEKVETKSILLNGEKQSPRVNVSKSASTIWENWKVVD